MNSTVRHRVLDAGAIFAMPDRGMMLVEASAGTGKTYAITNLYLRYLLDGYAVKSILVVTYTNAATDELRGRIRKRIGEAIAFLERGAGEGSDAFFVCWRQRLADEADRKQALRQLQLALHSLDEAAIYTIHAFCQRMLSEQAFQSCQPFELEMISDDSPLWQEALKDWWRRRIAPADAEVLPLLLDAVGSLDGWIKLHKPLRRSGVVLKPDAAQDVAALLAGLPALRAQFMQLKQIFLQQRQAIEAVLQSPAMMRRKHVYKLDFLPQLMAILAAYADAPTWLDYPAELDALRQSALLANCKKSGDAQTLMHPFFAQIESALDALRAFRAALKPALLHDADAFARRQVDAAKAARGQLAFDDQLRMLATAVEESPQLAATIGSRFPVAMIDEFQDTDALQYTIFHTIYGGGEARSLLMIGDPKQAIYSFRGGDIFTYMRAKADADRHYTLDTNWRSTEAVVRVVNGMFCHRPTPFLYDAIPFTPVRASVDVQAQLQIHGELQPAMTLWQLPLGAKGKPMSQADMLPRLHARTADEIARLLGQQSSQGDADPAPVMLGDAPLQAGDIAVLVRRHREAIGLRDALAQRGIAAVIGGGASVFESDEAAGLLMILEAVLACRNSELLRRALASPLWGHDYRAIHAIIDDEQCWNGWCEQMTALQRVWLRRGFMAMFQQLFRLFYDDELRCNDQRIAPAGIERRLTNLLHLGELLQQAERRVSGAEALLQWFQHQIHDEQGRVEESELRLESDRNLVRIVTIHAAKGLEYPVLFLPYLSICKPRDAAGLLPYFDAQQGVHTLALDADAQQYCRSEKERLAEDVRLLYVALTRACSKIYLAWGAVGNSTGKSALDWLLAPAQNAADLSHSTPAAFGEKNTALDRQGEHLAQLAAALGDDLQLELLSDALADEGDVGRAEVCEAGEGRDAADYQAVHFDGTIAEDWRISSFTALTRDVHQQFPIAQVACSDEIFNFPAGSRIGTFLHQLLESLDFRGDIAAHTDRFVQRHGGRFGIDGAQSELIQQWMTQVVRCPLNASGFALRDLDMQHRLNELDFDLSVAQLDVERLNRLLAQAAGKPLPPLTAANSRGFLTGVIDLVFERDGRFYLADYKSNRLGFHLDDYAPPLLTRAVYERRYDLQYLLYVLALHRYLRLRLPDYDYERHFGGVYYLFLRAMRPAHGDRFGIYFTRPDGALIAQLDAAFAAEAGA